MHVATQQIKRQTPNMRVAFGVANQNFWRIVALAAFSATVYTWVRYLVLSVLRAIPLLGRWIDSGRIVAAGMQADDIAALGRQAFRRGLTPPPTVRADRALIAVGQMAAQPFLVWPFVGAVAKPEILQLFEHRSDQAKAYTMTMCNSTRKISAKLSGT